ncbi:MAG: Yip1 family protein [Sterolibacterium sp.]|nr:Yip1 family protein [Sterolibacterium sp.]
MNIMSLPKMAVSSGEEWDEIEKSHPSIAKLFAYLVLPLSVLPPVMLYFTGKHYGDDFIPGFGGRHWEVISTVFFLGELLTFGVMGWLTKQITQYNKVDISYHDAYMLAGIAPLPLWLSSLGLLVPNLIFNAGVSLAALAMTCSLIYHGVYSLCHMREEVSAMAITQVVFGTGMAFWAILLVTILPL